MSTRVCAVVVTYNRKELLQECLQALRGQTRPPDKILVVNNASTDGTREMVETDFGEVKLLNLSKNMGGAGGFCEGMRWAFNEGFDWIWVMDDDAVPDRSALQRSVEHPFFSDPRVGILVPVVVGADGYVQAYHHKLVDRWLRETSALPGDRLTVEDVQRFGCEVKLDANCFVGPLIRREVVARCGLPNPDFFIMADDLEYTYRVTRVFNMYLVTEASVTHNDGRYSRSKPGRARTDFEKYWKTYYLIRNRIYFIRQYLPRQHILKFYLSVARSFARSTLGVILLDNHKRRRLALLMRAYADGFWGRLGQRYGRF